MTAVASVMNLRNLSILSRLTLLVLAVMLPATGLLAWLIVAEAPELARIIVVGLAMGLAAEAMVVLDADFRVVLFGKPRVISPKACGACAGPGKQSRDCSMT